MATFRQWLDAFAERFGEPTCFMCGTESSWGDYGMDDFPPPNQTDPFTPPCDEFLDYEFSNGYGAPGCPAIYAWSTTHVFITTTYDGSTDWGAVPRFPTLERPSMFGG